MKMMMGFVSIAYWTRVWFLYRHKIKRFSILLKRKRAEDEMINEMLEESLKTLRRRYPDEAVDLFITAFLKGDSLTSVGLSTLLLITIGTSYLTYLIAHTDDEELKEAAKDILISGEMTVTCDEGYSRVLFKLIDRWLRPANISDDAKASIIWNLPGLDNQCRNLLLNNLEIDRNVIR